MCGCVCVPLCVCLFGCLSLFFFFLFAFFFFSSLPPPPSLSPPFVSVHVCAYLLLSSNIAQLCDHCCLCMHQHAACFCCVYAADVKKAKEGGFYTIQSLIMNPRKVTWLTGLKCFRRCIFALLQPATGQQAGTAAKRMAVWYMVYQNPCHFSIQAAPYMGRMALCSCRCLLLCCCCFAAATLLLLLQRLHAVKGLSEAKADKMVEAAKKLTTAGSWITGAEAMQKVGRQAHVPRPGPGHWMWHIMWCHETCCTVPAGTVTLGGNVLLTAADMARVYMCCFST